MGDIPHTHEMLPALQEFMRQAILYSCGETVSSLIDDYPVSFGNTWRCNGDFQCFVAAAIFSRTIGMQNKEKAAAEAALVMIEENSCDNSNNELMLKSKNVSAPLLCCCEVCVYVFICVYICIRRPLCSI